MLLIRIMNLKMLFSMVIFKDSFRLNLADLKELNMNLVVIINMKFLKNEEKIVLYQLKAIVLPNVLFL